MLLQLVTFCNVDFALTKRAIFVNHRTHTVSFDCPPKPAKGEELYPLSEMPHYRANLSTLVSLVEKQISLQSKLLQYILVQNDSNKRKNNQLLAQKLEANLLETGKKTPCFNTCTSFYNRKLIVFLTNGSTYYFNNARNCRISEF
jgi:hypothetical protein